MSTTQERAARYLEEVTTGPRMNGREPDPVESPPEHEPDRAPPGDDLPTSAVERHRGSLVDWDELWRKDLNASDWLLEPILPRGRGVAMYASPKAGKSILALDMAARLATGRRCLDQPAGDPVHVLYVDAEMTTDDLLERLGDMGYGPTDDLSHLHYHVLPDLPPLDTSEGGRELADLADAYTAELVVLDTVAAVVAGNENDADTYRNYWTHTGRRLKADGRTVLRQDHAGKDRSKGQRGSSAKAGDVDVVWELREMDGAAVQLKATHRRLGWVPEKLDLLRLEDPLRHERAHGAWPAGTAELAATCDELDLPHDISRRDAREALKANGRTPGRNDVLAAALRWRRQEGQP